LVFIFSEWTRTLLGIDPAVPLLNQVQVEISLKGAWRTFYR